MNDLAFFRPTKAVVDLAAIRQNVGQLRQFLDLNVSIMAVVKANAYGHGDIQVAKAALASGANMLAVATPEEALHMRRHFSDVDILILGASPPTFAKYAIENNIILTVYSKEWIHAVRAESQLASSPLRVHLKIDSGMGRIGVRSQQEFEDLYRTIREEEKIEIDGVFTHFATADEENDSYYKKQLQKFQEIISTLPEKPRLVHASNSASALLKQEALFDAVRFGISMYGIAPSPYAEAHLPFPLQPALSLESELTHVKQVESCASIGYGATYTSKDVEWIGTIPIGYADGLLRGLSGQQVLIEGVRVPIVGRICMDQCMVKLPREMAVGEKVTFIGKQHDEVIRVEEWAEKLQTIPYEVTCMLSERIPRVFKNTVT